MRSLGLPEVIALMGVFVFVPLAALILVYLLRHLQTKERIRAIEKGVALPQILGDPWDRAVRTRRMAIVLIAGGLGLLFFFGVVASSEKDGVIGMAFTAIPILIGLGLLYEYYLRARELGVRPPAQAPDNSAPER